ncbi:XrtB/PEP-CTERM-associated polysaccharide biosynthesis outer membrane protein EpsL [Polaromonas sp.]|uniref:XrtB/PEP-CTERM-associated polysaccharide biosynthesis outer membrane protein EpsL n=1 Tax=Polaromonas sp. TaxID=1869339 RepID=UPI0013BE74BC|nr:XrtB/PEP-CTERM-associated polysaccharide biosynthesis outer membrane protein EpsL [Polaromonas sp.]NDP64405.1 putative exosortase B-associated extracellular polysaccharide biosynthesis transporter EpsL [Polaromonas sp.]
MLLRKLLVLNLALAGVVTLNARADELDTFQFRAGQTWQYDSNVFRLSDAVNSQAIIGSGSSSDHYGVTTIGAKIDKSYGLQRFEIDVNANRYAYKNFSNLDFTAVNYAAAWRWSLTPSFYGNLTTDRQEYTDNTADVQNQGQVNRRTDRLTLLDAEYAIDGPWRVLGGVFERSSSNSQAVTFEGDSKVRGVEVGVRYVFASDSSFAYRLKQGKGEYPNRVLSSTSASDFKDREHEFKLVWPITGITTIQSRLSYFDRAHDGLAARDFSGFVGQLEATWKPTGKTTVNGGVARDLGDYQTNNISYFQGNRFFIAPTWKPTEKTAVKFRYDHGVRNYKGSLPGFIALNRRDTTDLSVLGFEWEVIRAVKLSTSVFSDRRKSNEFGADYKSHGINFAVLASF